MTERIIYGRNREGRRDQERNVGGLKKEKNYGKAQIKDMTGD